MSLKVGTNDAPELQPPTNGTHDAVFAEVADLGITEHSQYGRRHQAVIVWQIAETHTEGDFAGERKEVRGYFDVDRGLGAINSNRGGTKLRKWLEGFRDKRFTKDELVKLSHPEHGLDLEQLIGKRCSVIVMRETTGDGKVYAKLIGLAPASKSNDLKVHDYTPLDRRGKDGGSRDDDDDSADSTADDDVPFEL